jgi:hypothetical protein
MDKYMKMLIIVVNYNLISIDSNIPSPNKKRLHLIWFFDNDSVTKYFRCDNQNISFMYVYSASY